MKWKNINNLLIILEFFFLKMFLKIFINFCYNFNFDILIKKEFLFINFYFIIF
jgi:hypothetical protein